MNKGLRSFFSNYHNIIKWGTIFSSYYAGKSVFYHANNIQNRIIDIVDKNSDLSVKFQRPLEIGFYTFPAATERQRAQELLDNSVNGPRNQLGKERYR